MAKCTYIDGIASSQALDTAGEIVDLKGLDTSSLVGAMINWEHKRDVPDQIVGKIVEINKIFSKEDCKNDRQAYYWSKIQLPFLYIKARLFDDRKPSAMEVAALFKDDADHPGEPDMLGFSVEGAKIEKQGAIITRSIARVVTLAHMPANKTCISEMVPDEKDKKKRDDIAELFKDETELLKFGSTYLEILEKKELKKTASVTPPPPPPPPPSSAGAAISGSFNGAMGFGKQEDMKKDSGMGIGAEVGSMAMAEKGWSKPDVGDSHVSYNHPRHGNIKISKTPHGNFEIHHNDKLVGVSPDVRRVGLHANRYMKMIRKNEESGTLAKALTAGSANAAPSQLVGGAALGKEHLEKATSPSVTATKQYRAQKGVHLAPSAKDKALGASVTGNQYRSGAADPAIASHKDKLKELRSMPSPNLGKAEKSHWFNRADEAYKTWDKKAKYQDYMKKRMPHLAAGEIDAIGRCLALKKTLTAEEKLSSMYAGSHRKAKKEEKE